MNAGVTIVPLPSTAREVDRFLRVSYGIYAGDPNWVAPMLMDLKTVFSARNPFFQHAEMALWVAQVGGRDVGRIAGIVDHNYNQYHHEQVAFFGFFECIDDAQVSRALFNTAVDWAGKKGALRILGPTNPSTNDEAGLLMRGFDSPPVFMMTYNPSYYKKLIENESFYKIKDLHAYLIDLKQSPVQRLERISSIFDQRQQPIRVRAVKKKNLRVDLGGIREVYNSAWEDNWGFVPMTSGEMELMAERLLPLFREGLVWLAETDDEPVAFLLALPDFNEAIQPLRGRLLSPGLWKFLPYYLDWKRPRVLRVVALGVKKKYRWKGIESVMFSRTLQYAIRAGYEAGEASWILEDNIKVQRLIQLFGGQPYKTYRLYERLLGVGQPVMQPL